MIVPALTPGQMMAAAERELPILARVLAGQDAAKGTEEASAHFIGFLTREHSEQFLAALVVAAVRQAGSRQEDPA